MGRLDNLYDSGSHLELIGGDFKLDGVEYSGSEVTATGNRIFTGILSDGSPFVFSGRSGDYLARVKLSRAPLPAADPTPRVVDTPLTGEPSGLRAGQTLTLIAGGEINDYYANVEGRLNIEGGVAGDQLTVVRGEVNLKSGAVGDFFRAYTGSEVNLFGGSIGECFEAHAGSEVNLFGTEFFLDGVPIESLVDGEAYEITSRNVTLTGLLVDGSFTSFFLGTSTTSALDFFDVSARVTVTLVSPIAGDFNNDGVVDAADYTAWRDGYSEGVYTLDDYLTWRDNFGHGDEGSFAVPEPATALLFPCLALLLPRRR